MRMPPRRGGRETVRNCAPESTKTAERSRSAAGRSFGGTRHGERTAQWHALQCAYEAVVRLRVDGKYEATGTRYGREVSA